MRAGSSKQHHTLPRFGTQLQRVNGGIGNMKHRTPRGTGHILRPVMRRIAGDGDRFRTRVGQPAGTFAHGVNRRFAGVMDGRKPARYLRYVPDHQRNVLLIAFSRREIDDFPHQIHRRGGPHTAEDANAAQRRERSKWLCVHGVSVRHM